MNNDSPPEIRFTDCTLVETEGVYQKTKEVMEKDSVSGKEWMIASDATITHAFGFCELELHLWNSGRLEIVAFSPSSGDVLYNPDIPLLSTWSQDNGWSVPFVSDDLVRANTEFWKHFWETLLVDSDFLEKRFGPRFEMPEDKEELDEE